MIVTADARSVRAALDQLLAIDLKVFNAVLLETGLPVITVEPKVLF